MKGSLSSWLKASPPPPQQRSTIVLVFVVLGCFLFYLSTTTNPIQQIIQKSWFLRNQYKHEHEDLAKVLKAASMPNRTVILTTLNDAWAAPGSIIDLFLESFLLGEGTEKLLKHLVIIAMDKKAFDRCKSIQNQHPLHCFSITTFGVDFAAEKRFMSQDYLKLMWRRINFLRNVLELGYNFVFTDADIMWFRDPFPYFNAQDDVTIACDYYKGKPRDPKNTANGGFIFVKSTTATIEFYKYWYKARLLHPKEHDQTVFEIIKRQQIVRKLRIKISYLDTKYFGGFCQSSRDMNKVCTMHANCCVGIEKKVYDLRLILDDWKNFTMLSPQDKISKGAHSSSVIPWRAPNKCKLW